MSEPCRRIKGYRELDDTVICYWKTDDSYKWLLYLPGCGVGALTLHQVEEHEDGTITVSPSIRVNGHDNGKSTERHGYINRGVWTEC
jgi:hypothetical protein